MATKLSLTHPWLVAVWPGMGHVALNAGYYLLAKLGMDVAAELEAGDLFDIDHVDVKGGRIQPARRPRNRFFVWHDPRGDRDLVVFLGEAQPPIGKYPFCRQLVSFAKDLGVERVLTFAAMATRMRPEARSRVFGAATDSEGVQELKRLELELVEEGQISGLNGVLLGVAADAGLHGACLLGEMPHLFAQLPFPKASLAVLEVFTTMTGIEVDFTELAEQAQVVEEQLGELMSRVEEGFNPGEPETDAVQADEDDEEDEDEAVPDPFAESKPEPNEAERIEGLFRQAARDRSKAFELKRMLDRLGLFKQYEDRFLDLFKKGRPNGG
jgi:proteasome assembly chaperone (PAC2) family protein